MKKKEEMKRKGRKGEEKRKERKGKEGKEERKEGMGAKIIPDSEVNSTMAVGSFKSAVLLLSIGLYHQ